MLTLTRSRAEIGRRHRADGLRMPPDPTSAFLCGLCGSAFDPDSVLQLHSYRYGDGIKTFCPTRKLLGLRFGFAF